MTPLNALKTERKRKAHTEEKEGKERAVSKTFAAN